MTVQLDLFANSKLQSGFSLVGSDFALISKYEVSKVATVLKVHKHEQIEDGGSISLRNVQAVYPATQFHGPKERKGRLHRRKTAKTREFDAVYKILRQQKLAAPPINKMEVTDTRQPTFLLISLADIAANSGHYLNDC
jgi:hypothetical protein